MISVGIIGASGYTGEELVKILQNHPEVEITSLTSRSHAGKKISDVFDLIKPLKGNFKSPTIDNLIGCDVVFFATPNGVAMEMAESLLDKGIRIIDISADFRIKNVEVWEKWYGKKHTSPSLLKNSVYGLPEIPGQKNKIRDALIVANPGCYPTASLLGLLPIYQLLSQQKIIINATSGISGAGRNLDSTKLFPEGKDNFQAYAVETHRHYPEMLEILNDNNSDLDILFVPHLSSMIRGIYSTIYLRHEYKKIEEVISEYQKFYASSPFVEVSENSSFPKVSEVEQTNMCKISLHATKDTVSGPNLVILSTIDNLVKGASGQAIQNMNIMFNLDEKLSLI
jgi:N-acetyl-gamma-glutamyl-phosphate reductase